MNAYAVVLKPAKVALILFALSAFMALAVVIGMNHYREKKEQTLLQTEQQLTLMRETIVKLNLDLDSIRTLATKYRQLTQLGFIGEANRDGWVAQLESIYRETRLPPTLRYTLATPQLLNPQAVAAGAPTAYLNNILHHDLELELSGIHEGEFLDFMDRLNSGWRTPYRIDTCQMARGEAVVSGLQIKCTIQLFSLPGKGLVSR
jgi:hypothetical protein